MAIRNFLFTAPVVLLMGCQTTPRLADSHKEEAVKTEKAEPVTKAPPVVNSLAPSAPVLSNEKPQVGIILGPGGLRSFAHIGVLQELAKARIPLRGIVGIEMGALVGGLYASKAQTFDVEWQMFKLKEEELFRRSFLSGGGPIEVSSLSDFLQMVFASAQVESAQLPFACPALHLGQQQVYMMNRGSFSVMVPFCLPSFPLMRPHDQNVAALTALQMAANHLRVKTGVKYLIYVDVLDGATAPFIGGIDSEENATWSQISQALRAQFSSVNKVISISLAGDSIVDFNKRRDMLQKGQEAGRQAAIEIARDLGL